LECFASFSISFRKDERYWGFVNVSDTFPERNFVPLGPASGAWSGLFVPTAALLGDVWGSGSPTDACSDPECRSELGIASRTCSKCGGLVAGTMLRRNIGSPSTKPSSGGRESALLLAAELGEGRSE
jgi:hypothetical protein